MIRFFTTQIFKRLGASFCAIIVFASVGIGQTTNYVSWDFTTSISNANYATNTTNQNGARTSALTTPTLSTITLVGVSGTTANTLHRTTGWPTSQSTSNYVQFSITLNSGQTFRNETLSLAISAQVSNTSTAARNYQVRYGYGSSPTFANATNGNVTNLGTSASSNTATIPAPGNTTSTILTIRIEGYGSSASSGNIQLRTIALTGSNPPNTGSTPTKLAITSISPSSPIAGSGFDVIVQSQDGSSIASNVAANTAFTLSNTGGGSISGTTTGTITAGANQVTVTGVILSTHATGVTLTATRTSGDVLTAATSSSFTVLATTPTVATNVTTSNRNTTSMDVGWTNGSGTGRIVVARLAATNAVAPATGTTYTPSLTGSFTGSTTTGTGNIVVYNGTGDNVAISNLTAATSYIFDVYEFNGTGATTNYSAAASSASTATLATEPTAQASITTISNPLSDGLTIGFSGGTGGSGRLVIVRPSNAVDFVPVDGTAYSANVNFSLGTGLGSSTDNKVVFAGSGSTVNVTGLTPNTIYHVAVYEYNGTGTSINYLTSIAASTGNRTTLATEPTANAGTPTFANTTTTSFDVNWAIASPAPTNYIVVRTTGANTPDNPVDGTGYFPGNAISSSTVVYVGSNLTLAQSSLTPGTEYRYRVFSFNGSGASSNYQLTSVSSGINFTLSLEPDAHAASFTATTASASSINLNFSAASTITNASGYLILQKTGSVPTGLPADGQSYNNGAIIGDAIVVATITNAATVSTTISSLSADENYYFSIIPFGWNSSNGETRNYYTQAIIPTATASTPSSSSDVIAVPSSSPTLISSLINNAPPLISTTGIQVWQITIRDGGSSLNDADNLPTKVSVITFTTGTGNQVTWNTAIKNAALFDGSTLVATASSITATTIIFNGLSLTIDDNTSKTLSLRISLNETLGSGNDDGDDFVFQLSQGNFITLEDGTSSQKNTSFTAINTANNTENVIDVVATKLVFEQQPTNGSTFTNISPAVTVRALDVNNNFDLGFTAHVNITATGAILVGSTVIQNAIAGLTTFSSLQFVTTGTGITLAANAASLTGTTSSTFNIVQEATVLVKWTFETSIPTSSGPHTAEIGTGNALGFHAGATTYDNPVGNGSTESFSSNNWQAGDYYQFQTSTIGYNSISISFDQTGSGTGPRDFKIQYSTDGTTFTDVSGGSYTVSLNTPSWNGSTYQSAFTQTVDLSSINALNNKANVYIRLTQETNLRITNSGLQTVATGGTNRVDNFSVSGLPSTFTWTGLGDGSNWSDPDNWDCACGLIPAANNAVVIPNSSNVVLDTNYIARNLQLQSTSTLTIAPNKILTVEGNAALNDQSVTIKSDATGTGAIGTVTGEILGATNVTVERYMSASSNRAWRLLTPGVSTSTNINANWQEGKVNTVINTNVPADVAGYGVHITGAGGNSNGFDVTQTNAASLYSFNQATQNWALITNTNVNTLDAKQGYLLFVRGNRDNITPINTATGSSNVTLRARGTLLQGTQTFSNLATANNFSLVTNPFASPIDWTTIYALANNATNFNGSVNIWDPNVGTRGGFVAINDIGIPSNGASLLTEHLQSGQAFFIQTKTGVSGNPSFIIEETHKSTTNNLDVFRTNTVLEKLKIQLRFTASNIQRIADGVVAIFSNTYSNGIDGRDAEQIANWDEDIALTRNGKDLSIESRNTITANDTLFLKIGNLRAAQVNYRWVIEPEQLNAAGLTAFLEDNFANTTTPISLTAATTINFTVSSSAASTAANRFRIVFRNNAALPVTITQIKAQQKGNDVQVLWNTVNEQNIQHYEVEKSTNAQQFSKIATVAAKTASSSNEYSMVDASVPSGTYYYRLKIVEKNGSYNYSKVVRLTIGKGNINTVSIYPNPIKGNTINLQLNNVEKGNYTIKVLNYAGQVVYQSNVQHLGGSATEQLVLSKALASGQYQLEMSNEKGMKMVQTIMKE